MASMSNWTAGDLAALTAEACRMSFTEEYCEHCMVVSVAEGDKYCYACTQELVDSMALAYSENVAVDGGLY